MNKLAHFILVFLFFWIVPAAAFAGDTGLCRGGVLISREIKPFVRMVEAVEENVDFPLCRLFLDKEGQVYSLDSPGVALDNEKWDFLIAVGPAALKRLVQEKAGIPVFYGMVLNPDEMIQKEAGFCGVSLNLFTSTRIRKAKRFFPGIKKAAVLFNPEKNTLYPAVAKEFQKVKGLDPLPVEVAGESEIQNALKTAVKESDAIYFIPDRTVISPAIVKYIIKYGIERGTPSFGYNRFFHQSGALLSFTADYSGIGRQLADMVMEFLETGNCSNENPAAGLLYNENVARLFKIEVNRKYLRRQLKNSN